MSGAVKERLKSVKSLVPSGTRLLDVGSDHAALPLSLLSEGKITCAVISDINEKPLERARTEAAKTVYYEKCSFVLSDGFDRIDPDSFETAAVCGMGGMLISTVIERAITNGRLKKSHILILQPMTDVHVVRKYLWDHGYAITDEIFSAEGKYDADPSKNKARPYVALRAEYDAVRRGYTFADLFLGKIRGDNAAFYCFREKTKRMLSNKLRGILISLKPSTEAKGIYRAPGLKDRIGRLKKDLFKDHLRKKLLK